MLNIQRNTTVSANYMKWPEYTLVIKFANVSKLQDYIYFSDLNNHPTL